MAGRTSPGPATLLLPNSVGGKQPNSRKSDPPVWGFGTASRFRPMSAPIIPAPGHYDRLENGSVGPQTDGRRRSEPIYGFGTAERKHVRKLLISPEHQKTDFYGIGSPGPATYGLKSALGKQDESKIATEPAWVFAGAARTKVEPGDASPGPKYMLPQAVGPQPDSRKPRAATPGFGAATREKQAKIFLGPEHEKAAHGKQSPGPAAGYQVGSSMGRQLHSKDREAKNTVFSKASRWASYEQELKKNTVPGPGAY